MRSMTLALDETARFHSRTASCVASVAQKFESMICFVSDGHMTDCKNVIALMNMAIPDNRILEIVADGSDEQTAISEIEYIITNMHWR